MSEPNELEYAWSIAEARNERICQLLEESLALRARVEKLEAWAQEWHETAEMMCLLAGVSQGLGPDEMVVAFRDANAALRARVAKLEAALKPFVSDGSNQPI